MRVEQEEWKAEPDGEETITVELGYPKLTLPRMLWRYGRRIEDLEGR